MQRLQGWLARVGELPVEIRIGRVLTDLSIKIKLDDRYGTPNNGTFSLMEHSFLMHCMCTRARFICAFRSGCFYMCAANAARADGDVYWTGAGCPHRARLHHWLQRSRPYKRQGLKS